MASIYEGLTRGQRMWIVGVAALIFIINMMLAWVVMNSATHNLQFSENDRHSITEISSNIGGPAYEPILRKHAIDAVTNMKLVANKQAIILAAFSGAFGLCAAGFALFLVGADGAFQFGAYHESSSAKIILTGTAPGLFCFLIAGILILSGVLHRSEIRLGDVVLPGNSTIQPLEYVTGGGVDQTLDSELDGMGLNKKVE